jgi:hypothetical protein
MANRVKTWTSEVLTSSDLNAEFDNIWANVTHTPVGTWTFSKSGTPITIQPSSAPAAGTKLLVINNNGAAELMSVDYEGDAYIKNTLMINETADPSVTVGLVINQGAADDAIIDLKSSDVAHGMTDLIETDSYGYVSKAHSTAGGLFLAGLSEGVMALIGCGYATSVDSTRSTSGVAALNLYARKKSGTGSGDMDADSNLLAIMNNNTTRFILDADGDSHQDVGTAWTNFDEHDDPALLESLSFAVSRQDDQIRRTFGEFLKYNRQALEASGLVKFNDDGHHFVNMSRLSMLLTGAIRQLARRLDLIEQKLLTA